MGVCRVLVGVIRLVGCFERVYGGGLYALV